jgi:hypothetical protein
MSKVLLSLVLLGVVGLTGCASKAGPFVTNISSDGRGGIVIEKCMVRLDRTINTVEASDCTNTSIRLTRPPETGKQP